MAVVREYEPEESAELYTPTIFRTDLELWQWVLDHLGIRIPTERCCPNHKAPFQAFADAYFARDDIAVWKASRAFGGKTVLLATLAMTEACTLGAGVTVLGGSGEQSRRVHGYLEGTDTNLARQFWNAPKAPRHLLRSALSTWRTSLRNGGWIHALLGSQRSVRGPHPQRLRMDEVDEMALPILDAALGQPMSAGRVRAHTVMSSTHQNPDGTMTEVLKRATERGWPVYEWCYKESSGENGWLEEAEVQRKRRTVSTVMWDTEFELQEPSPEGRAMDLEAVQAMFDPERGSYAGLQGEVLVFEPPAWELEDDWPAVPGWYRELEQEEQRKCRSSRRWRMRHLTAEHQESWKAYREQAEAVQERIGVRYAAGADWGKERDHTIIWVLRIDCRPRKWVAYANLRREPYPLMFGKFNDLVARYDALAAHDATGIGTAAEDYMEGPVVDYKMVGQDRVDLFNDYLVAVEERAFVGPRIEHPFAEHKYCTQEDLWGRGHPPDSVVAAAMAWQAARRSRPLVR